MRNLFSRSSSQGQFLLIARKLGLANLRIPCKAYRQVAFTSVEQRDSLLPMSRRRSAFIEELSSIVRCLGGSPQQGGSALAGVRRAVFEMRATMSGAHHLGDELAECARVEGDVVDAYDNALKKTTWAKVTNETVRERLTEIRGDYDALREWRGSL